MIMTRRSFIYGIAGIGIALAAWGGSTAFTGETKNSVIERAPAHSDSHEETKIVEQEPVENDFVKMLETFRGKDVERVSVNEKIFALTFDGGGSAESTERILDTLKKHSVSATFFLTGQFMESFPEATEAIRKSGGEIANHTMTHKDLSKISLKEVSEEIDGMDRVAKEKGIVVAPFFRFPYGAPTKETIALVNDRGYVSVRWTVDSLGWQGAKDGRDASFVADRVIQKAVPGGIALMHLGAAKDGTAFDADALETIISELSKQGYQFVPFSELFNVSIAQ